MRTSRFQFSNPELTEIEFYVNNDFKISEGENVDIKIETNININQVREKKEALVELEVIIGERSEKYPFYICVNEQAAFRWDNEVENEDLLLKQNAPALLFSYIRPIIATITASSKYPAYDLPFVNFTE